MTTKYHLHRTNILKTIYEKGKFSRKDLHELLDIRFATITEIIKELIKEGIVKEVGKRKNEKGGRPHSLLSIVPDSKFFIGCELTTTGIYSVILNFEGKIIKSETIDLDLNESKENIKEKIVYLIKNVILKCGSDKNKICGIGFVDPGIVDTEKGISLFSSIMPQWRDVPIKNYIENEVSIETFVIGTSQAKVLSEKFFGKGKNYRNFLFVEYGEGIGCGIISDNRVVHGAGGVAGEFGHIKINGRTEKCNCGGNGCLEAIASIPSIIKKIKEATKKDMNISEIVSRYLKGEKIIKTILDEILEIFSISVANLVNLFNSELVIFDRNFEIYKDFLGEIIRKIEENMVYKYPVRFEISDFGKEIGAIGGACFSISKFLKLDN